MQSFGFGVHTTPLLLDSDVIMPRADDVDAIQRMLADAQTRTVILVGDTGVGKSTLAALIYSHLLSAQQAQMSPPRYLVWLTVNMYTTLSDILAAVLQGIELQVMDFYLLPLEQQISLVQQTLQRSEVNALFILDQFEALLTVRASNEGLTSRELQLLLALLQTDIGFSRFLLTSTVASFGEQTHIPRYRVSRVSMPEGTMLLQQGGIQGTPQDLSYVWQRCNGHVFALRLFCSLVKLSGIAPGYLLVSPEYQSLWNGEVASNILALLYRYLSPLQRQILRYLSLFNEPVSLDTLLQAIRSTKNTSGLLNSSHANVGQELQTLSHLSLVQSLQDSMLDAMFALHPVISQFVQEHSIEGTYPTQERDAQSDLSRELAAGHIAIANYYYSITPPREQRTSLQHIEPLLNTIRHLCLGQQWQGACNLLFKEDLHENLIYWGAWRTLIMLYIMLSSGSITRRDEGLIFSHLAMLYGRMGNKQQSQSYVEQALTIQHEIEDTHGEAVTLTNQGELCRMQGEREQARTSFEKAMLLSKQQPDQQQEKQLQCILLHNMGLLYADVQNYGPALNCYLQALRLTYELQDQQKRGTVLTNLGLLLFAQGQQREGVAVLLTALQLRQALRDPSVGLLERFFTALKQRLGPQAYASLYQNAFDTQEQVLVSLIQMPA